ncbi:MAG TPA: hypothetical protein PLU23_07775 [Anaerolineaceae bacterium]|mgnify:CR=1 FL=1|nr:hypothetical protein [Anaerolineaceae bacterium]
MTFKAKIEHAAAVTKWKADQQIRIVRTQSQISDMEKQIKDRVYGLGEATLALSDRGGVNQPELQPHLHDLNEMRKYLAQLQTTLEAIKNEAPPPPPVEPEMTPVTAYTGASGLVCPQCGMVLIGKFCPEHGLEGVVPAPPPQLETPVQPVVDGFVPVMTPVESVPPPLPDSPAVFPFRQPSQEPRPEAEESQPPMPPMPPIPPMPDLSELPDLEDETIKDDGAEFFSDGNDLIEDVETFNEASKETDSWVSVGESHPSPPMPPMPPVPPMPELSQTTETAVSIEQEINEAMSEAKREISESMDEVWHEVGSINAAPHAQLYCPICDQALEDGFCPEHGVPGIAKEA